jgi:hypothetical protein
MERTRFHVIRQGDHQWRVVRVGALFGLIYRSRDQAVAIAKIRALCAQPAHIAIHDCCGAVEQEYFFG